MTDPAVGARAPAEARLVEQCVIRGPGADEFSTEAGLEAVPGPLVWQGPCKLGASKGPGSPSRAAGEERLVAAWDLLLPSTASCSVGDRVTVTGRSGVYVVVEPDERPTPVLRHVEVRRARPGEGQPR